MSDIKTGGPVFPTDSAQQTGTRTWHYEGMTLRDYFAAKANEDDIAAHSLKGFKEEYVLDLGNGNKELRIREARWSREEAKYRYADAMIVARKAA